MKKQAVITYTSLSVSWLLLMLAIFAVILSSCTKDRIAGSGNVVEETRNTSPFTDVEIAGSFEVHLLQDSSARVEIKAEDNIIGSIETNTSNRTLYIKVKDRVSVHPRRPMQVYVHSRIFQRINFKGSGTLANKDTIQGSVFSYVIDGSGDAALVLAVQDLKTDINGSGTVQVKGKATNLNSEINGHGNVEALELQVQNADITIRGSGAQTIHVSNELKVGIYGSGNVTYAGNPLQVKSDIKGSGRLIKI